MQEHEHDLAYRGTVSWNGRRYKLFVCKDSTCNLELTFPDSQEEIND